MLDQELGDGRQIVGDDTPTDPTFHALFAMRQTTVQVAGASQLADAAFDPIAEALGHPEPGLFLLLAAAICFVAGLRQADPPHAQRPGLLLVVGRVNAAIPTDFPGRFAKQLAMLPQTGDQKLRFVRVALQEAIFANQTAIDFGIPNLAPELGLFGFGFATANQGGVGLEQAQHFLAGGCRLPVQDSLLGLVNDLLHQGQILIKLFIQPIGPGVLQGGQAGLELRDLLQQGLHDCQQFLIQFQAGFCRVFGFRTAQAADIPSQAMSLPVSIAKPFLVGYRAEWQQVAHLPHPSTQHAGRIVQQAAVGRIVNIGLRYRAVQPKFLGLRHAQLSAPRHDHFMDQANGLGPQLGLPILDRPKIRHAFQIQLADPAPASIHIQLLHRRSIAPTHQAPQDRHTDGDIRRQGWRTPRSRPVFAMEPGHVVPPVAPWHPRRPPATDHAIAEILASLAPVQPDHSQKTGPSPGML